MSAPPVATVEPSPPAQPPAPDFVSGLPVAVAAFVTGAVLLAVEIAASRVVSPFFGSSLFVWGALIGVVLTGLAIGYAAGGALADRRPGPALLVAVMAAGAVSVAAIPFLDDPVLEAIVEWDPGPRLDPLIAAVALFGLPSVLLASVSPIAVRLRTRAVATAGRTAGRLFAISTAGSITGTFVTAFWLVPELGTDQLLAYAAGLVFVAAAIVAMTAHMPAAFSLAGGGAVAAVVAGILLAPGDGGELSGVAAQNWSPVYRRSGRPAGGPVDYGTRKVLLRRDTRYHRLAVTQAGDFRELRFGSSYQSAMNVAAPYETQYPYTDFFHLGLAYRPSATNFLMLGMGGATIPRRLLRDFPSLDVQVVELDPVVVDVARKYFALPDDEPRLGVDVQDGRRWLATHDRRFDVIGVDTYFEDAIPFHMTTREFLELARTRLKPGGVVVANVIGSLAGDRSRLFRSIYRTYRSVFPTVAVHPVGFEDRSLARVRNLIIVATDAPAPERKALLERWDRTRPPEAPTLQRAIGDRWERLLETGDVPTLTDDYAPTDALLAG
jgi:spermidine synthase